MKLIECEVYRQDTNNLVHVGGCGYNRYYRCTETIDADLYDWFSNEGNLVNHPVGGKIALVWTYQFGHSKYPLELPVETYKKIREMYINECGVKKVC